MRKMVIISVGTFILALVTTLIFLYRPRTEEEKVVRDDITSAQIFHESLTAQGKQGNSEGESRVLASYNEKKVEVVITPCETADIAVCFGSGAWPVISSSPFVQESLWDLVSTGDALSFGVSKKSGNKWPYTITIGVNNDEASYLYFKEHVLDIFNKSVKMSQ